MKSRSIISGIYTLASLVLACCVAYGQNYPPVAEGPSSLLSIRFYDQNGGFMVDNLQMVFPPAASQSIEFSIEEANGSSVASVPLQVENWNNRPVFARLRPGSGHPGVLPIGRAGEFIMAVKVDGKTVTSVPFSMKMVSSGDPFNPRKTFTREGPWPTIGYLGDNVDRADDNLMFNFWSCGRELPAGKTSGPLTVHLNQNGQEIAESAGSVSVSGTSWTHRQVRLRQPRAAGGKKFTKAMLCQNDGTYTIVIKYQDSVIKTFKAVVRGGELQRLERNSLDRLPDNEFISPRLIDTLQGIGSRSFMVDAYWLQTE